MKRILGTFAVVVCATAHAWAVDPWENGLGGSDDFTSTPNLAVHGRPQTHDLETEVGGPFVDVDFVRMRTRSRHSYEARVYSASVRFGTPGATCTGGVCGAFGRYDDTGILNQTATGVDGDPLAASLRWTADDDGVQLLRMTGGAGASGLPTDQYTLEVTDTTLFAPRFNNSGTQMTILILQNTTTVPVNGSASFVDPSGVVLGGVGFNIVGAGVMVLNTASFPGGAGASGSILIAQDGGYAALTGKAVALEPATGFTFDTAVTPVPR
jgi:hypothetical protein